MAAQVAEQLPEEPTFGIGDRLSKSRHWCGIKSAAIMAERLSERLGKPIPASTVSSWEAGAQPTKLIRLDDLVSAWISICNEAGAAIGRCTSAAFIYGVGSQNLKDLTGADLHLVHDSTTATEDTRPGPGQQEIPFPARLHLVRS